MAWHWQWQRQHSESYSTRADYISHWSVRSQAPKTSKKGSAIVAYIITERGGGKKSCNTSLNTQGILVLERQEWTPLAMSMCGSWTSTPCHTDILIFRPQSNVGDKHSSTMSSRFGFSNAAATRSLSFSCLFTDKKKSWDIQPSDRNGNYCRSCKYRTHTSSFSCMWSRGNPYVHL